MLNIIYSDDKGLYKWLYDTSKEKDEHNHEVKEYICLWEEVHIPYSYKLGRSHG